MSNKTYSSKEVNEIINLLKQGKKIKHDLSIEGSYNYYDRVKNSVFCFIPSRGKCVDLTIGYGSLATFESKITNDWSYLIWEEVYNSKVEHKEAIEIPQVCVRCKAHDSYNEKYQGSWYCYQHNPKFSL